MLRKYSRAIITLLIAAGLFAAAIRAGEGLATSLADWNDRRPDSGSQTSSLVATAGQQQHMFAKSDAPMIGTTHVEPFWLLVLGATLLAIGTSIKRLARAEVKTPLPERKSERVL